MNWLLTAVLIITISGCNKKHKMKYYSSSDFSVICIKGQQFVRGYKMLANYLDKDGKPRSCVVQVKK